LPGTALYERVKSRAVNGWRLETNLFSDHSLIYESEFSEAKLRFAIFKGQVQFCLKKWLGFGAFPVNKPFEMLTDRAFKIMK